MNTFGRVFRVTTFGESHGPALGAVIDGVPPGRLLDVADVQADLDRRRPGQSALTSARDEADRVEVLAGLFDGRTTGAPLVLAVHNRDADPSAYAPFKDLYRPSHADYTTEARYGLRDWRGGGRASARETVARVAAGAVARQLLAGIGVEVVGWVAQVGDVVADVAAEGVDRAAVEAQAVRCPDPVAAERMEALIRAVRAEKDTVGGVVRAVARRVPAGWGAPVFGKLDADLAAAMLSLPAAKGFEVGSGFSGARLRGSEHNDRFHVEPGAPRPVASGVVRLGTATNHSGGIQGGISNGMPIELAVAFKPVATIFQPQPTVDRGGAPATLVPRGRHDACVLPRAVPIVEAMLLLVLVDHWLQSQTIHP